VPVQPQRAPHHLVPDQLHDLPAGVVCRPAAPRHSVHSARAPAGPRRPTLRHRPDRARRRGALLCRRRAARPRPATCAQVESRDLRRPLPRRARAGRPTRQPTHWGANARRRPPRDPVEVQGGEAGAPGASTSSSRQGAGRARPSRAGHRTATHQPTRASAAQFRQAVEVGDRRADGHAVAEHPVHRLVGGRRACGSHGPTRPIMRRRGCAAPGRVAADLDALVGGRRTRCSGTCTSASCVSGRRASSSRPLAPLESPAG